MAIAEPDLERSVRTGAPYSTSIHWPVNWSAIWVGALAAIVVALLFGLVGIAVGAHVLDPEQRVVDLKKVTLITLGFSVFGSFFSFAAGGWIAGKIAGVLRSEPAMLHGAIAWLLAVPILMTLAGLGAGSFFGGWYAGLAGTSASDQHAGAPFQRPEALAPNATDAERAQYLAAQSQYREKMQQWGEDTPKATRNSALGALTALLLGLVGAVIGGWASSGEPMTLTHYRNRQDTGRRFS